MATEQELAQAESEAQRVLQQQTPQRRFGAGRDVRQEQINLQKKKDIARQNLAEVQRARQEQVQQQASEKELQIAYQKGAQDQLKGGSRKFDNPEIQKAYEEGRRGAARAEATTDIKAGEQAQREAAKLRFEQQLASGQTQTPTNFANQSFPEGKGYTTASGQVIITRPKPTGYSPISLVGGGTGYLVQTPEGVKEYVPIQSSTSGGKVYVPRESIRTAKQETPTQKKETNKYLKPFVKYAGEQVQGIKQEQLQRKASGTPLQKFGAGFFLTGVNTLEFGYQQVKKAPSRLNFISQALFTEGFAREKALSFGQRLYTGFTSGEYKQIASNKFQELGTLIKTEPYYALGRITGEVVLNKGLTKTGELSQEFYTAVRYKPLEEGAVVLKSGTKIKIIKQGVPTMSFERQLALAGQERTLVSTSQGLFGTFFKREVTISKPIATEKLSVQGKILLEEYDAGRQLTPQQLTRLDIEIRKTGSKGILERTFFADPLGRARLSRLGVQQERKATISELLSGKVTFKKPRPQVIIFEQHKIAPISSSLKETVLKAKRGETLSSEEYGRLLRFQTESTGQFKPVGFLTREAEVVATGILKKKAVVATRRVGTKKVELITAELIKPSAKERLIFEEAVRTKNIRKLSEITGFSESELSSAINPKPYYNPSRALSPFSAVGRLSYSNQRQTSPKKVSSPIFRTSRVSSPKPTSKPNYPKRYTVNYKPSGGLVPNKPSTSPRFNPFRYPKPPKPPVKSPPNILKYPYPKTPEGNAAKKLKRISEVPSKVAGGINVLLRRGGKFFVIGSKLTAREAQALGKKAANITLGRTIKFTGNRGELKKLKIDRQFFRTAKGRSKLKTPFTFIEKTKFALSTKGETEEIQVAKLR